VCIVGELLFATIGLVLLQSNRFLLLWYVMVAKVGLETIMTRVTIWTIEAS
jgi:hypothetical protein